MCKVTQGLNLQLLPIGTRQLKCQIGLQNPETGVPNWASGTTWFFSRLLIQLLNRWAILLPSHLCLELHMRSSKKKMLAKRDVYKLKYCTSRHFNYPGNQSCLGWHQRMWAKLQHYIAQFAEIWVQGRKDMDAFQWHDNCRKKRH